MSVRIEVNNSAFRAMAVGPEIASACVAEASRAAGIAKALAEDFRVSGNYAESFVVSAETVRLSTGFGEHDVAAGVLTNRSPHAAAVEWGNEHDHRAHHVLGRTLAALGDG